MEEEVRYQRIIDKLKNGMQFGMFEDGHKCYFQDGEKVHYTHLWRALRIVYQLPDGVHRKTLTELCPDLFVGAFPYSFSRHQWKKKAGAKQ